jgi:methionyl-tRNA formyltransferase
MSPLITMFLMNQKGYEVLKEFISKFGVEYIAVVVSSRDINVEKDYFEEISELCKFNKIKLLSRNEVLNISTIYSFAIGWRWIIKTNSKLIVLHDSILPQYRGFAPLVSSLINKENIVGVTALFASDDYDKGEIIDQLSVTIEYPLKINKAIEIISHLYVSIVLKISEQIINLEELKSYKQEEKHATYSLWRDEEDYKIDWKGDAEYIKRFIDSVGFPYKGAFSFIDGEKVRIYDSEVVQDVNIENRSSGKVIFIKDGFPTVVCGKGLLKLTHITSEIDNTSLIPLKKFRLRFE